MARFDFGGTLADFVVSARRLGGIDVLGLASATLTLWSAQTGGTRYTDLVVNGSSVASITVGTDGQVPKFQGPDGVTEMWVDGGSPRIRIVTLQGAQGPQGLPGVNAVANDTATAGYISSAGSATQSAADARYSKKSDTSVFNVKLYGATGNGTTDDTAAILSARDALAAAGGGVLFFPPGRYLARLLRLNTSNVIVRGNGATLVYRPTGAALTDGLLCWGDQASVGGTTAASNFHDILIEEMAFEGTGSTSGVIENQALVALSGVSDVTIRKCSFRNMQGDGVQLFATTSANTERHNQRVTITDCLFDGLGNYGRQGVSIIEGSSVAISNCRFLNCASSGMPGAVDIEPNIFDTWSIIRDISVTGCVFDNCGGNVGDVIVALNPPSFTNGTPSGFRFEGNVHLNSRKGAYFVTWIGHAATAADTHMGITIRGNYTKGSGANTSQWSYVGGVRGVRVEGNTVTDWPSYVGIIGPSAALAVDSVEYVGNTLLGVSVVGGVAISALKHTNTVFARNRVTRATAWIEGLVGLEANGSSSGLRVSDNDCLGATVNHAALLNTGHTTTVSTNRAPGNINLVNAPNTAIFAGAPSVTGSRSGNAAVASLLTALAASGQIQDGTSAGVASAAAGGLVRTMISGRYYGPQPATPTGTNLADSSLNLVPLWVPAGGVTVAEIACEVTSASAGAVALRLGIYGSDASDMPSNRILDAGVTSSDGTTLGVKAITGLSTVLASGLYWLAFVPQGGLVGVRTVGPNSVPPVSATSFVGGGATGGPSAYVMVGVSGALPATFVSNGAANFGALVKIKAA